MTFKNVSNDFQNFNFTIGLIMLFVDTTLWLLLGIYLEAVLPKEFGQRRHPCFCFAKRKSVNKTSHEMNILNEECFEPVSKEVGERPSLTINSLMKVFDK